MKILDEKFVTSWSGGKDSCLAHFRALNDGGIPNGLLTMIDESGNHSISHYLPIEVLQSQADSIGLPLITRKANWQTYKKYFIDGMCEAIKMDCSVGVFGDIDLEDHLRWVEKTCKIAGIQSYHPLWKESRKDLLYEFIDAGFKAMIIVINNEKLPPTFLGRLFTKEVIEEIESYGVDACGEEGELHTVVFDGPIFTKTVHIQREQLVQKGNYTFQLVSLKD